MEELYLKEHLEAMIAARNPETTYTDGSSVTLSHPDMDTIDRQMRIAAKHLSGFQELMMVYSCAIKEVQTKFDVLNTEFSVRYRRNPIYCINTRLKRPASILDKLKRLHLPITLESIENELHDVAGVRVICSFRDDIYRIADALLRQNDVELLTKKDYIVSPKANGYRSLHLIVRIPIFFANVTHKVKVEVQIRTIAMDCWASLEHQLKYKQEVPGEEDIVRELFTCAEMLAETDAKMLAIRREIEHGEDIPDGESLVIERLQKLGSSLK
jgi:putative GTP pyrophosphokinase